MLNYLKKLGDIFGGSAVPADSDPSKPTFNKSRLSTGLDQAAEIDNIKAVPLKNGNYNVYLHANRNLFGLTHGFDHTLLLGEFPAEVYQALVGKNIGGFKTTFVHEYASVYAETKALQLVDDFIETFGVKPVKGATPNSLADIYAWDAVEESRQRGRREEQEIRQWKQDVVKMTPMKYEDLERLIETQGAALDPSCDVGDRCPEYVAGHIAQWDGPAVSIEIPAGNLNYSYGYNTKPFADIGEKKFVALKRGDCVSIFQNVDHKTGKLSGQPCIDAGRNPGSLGYTGPQDRLPAIGKPATAFPA